VSDDYTNLDLDTAEELLIAAGKPELAQALRYQAQGVRNLVQGAWGQSFMTALDTVLERRLQAYNDEHTILLAGVQNSLQLLNTTVAEVLHTAQQALTVAKAGAARLGKLEKDTATLKRGQARISGEVNELRERLDRKRHELDDIHAWQKVIDARIAAYPDEEIQELIAYVRRKMAEEYDDHASG
jgi:DNA repair ATPase RecN